MVLIIHNNYRFIDQLEQLIDESDEFKTITIGEFKKEEFKNYNALILAFSDVIFSDQDPTPYVEKLKFIKNIEIPILGIGVGHHLVGLIFGANSAHQQYRSDFETISIIEEDELTDKLPADFEVSFNHASTISIPIDFKLLASSDNSINEIMKHNKKNIYGIQFHPEISGNFGRIILNNFLELN